MPAMAATNSAASTTVGQMKTMTHARNPLNARKAVLRSVYIESRDTTCPVARRWLRRRLLASRRSAPRGATARRRAVESSAGFAPIAPLVEAAIARHELPGAVVLVGRGDAIVYHAAFGQRAVAPARGADDRRHDLRSRLAHQGRGDDDERDAAGRGGAHPAERSGGARSFPSSASTASAASRSVIC